MRDQELLRRARQMRANLTPPEARLWYHLRAKRFEATKFRFQTVLGRYIVDFTSRTAMLAIEVDGDTHAHQQDYDARRTAFLEARGFRLLRFTNSDVMTNLEGVLHVISEALQTSLSPLAGRGREPTKSAEGRGPETKTESPPLPASLPLSYPLPASGERETIIPGKTMFRLI